MKRQKLLILVTVLALIAGAAAVLWRYQAIQKLGQPGVKTQPLPATGNLEVLLPERVLDYSSVVVPQPQVVLDLLPKDTSFGQRVYKAPDGSWLQMNVVLMGADRTSIHKPQICIPGNGFVISQTEIIHAPITQPHPYDLAVIKLIVSKPTATPTPTPTRGMFIYWFVANGVLSADVSAFRRLWLNSKSLFQTGELQRWAYVTCFSTFREGEEQACLDRLKLFLADAVPQFQLTAGSPHPAAVTAANP